MSVHASRWLLLPLALVLGCGPGELADDEDAEESSAIVASPPFSGDPAHGAVFAIDISHWEGPISQREMDCFWESGVRHVVSGTQVEEVTRQQLAMATARGMTVDAYVYLYWSRDMAAQVDAAFGIARGYPIERMWLDVEEAPAGLGADRLAELVQQALDRCRAQGTVTCGIYTGPGFWKTWMNDTRRFAEVPLWYAWYNAQTSLSRWTAEHFGGWASPAAKQWAEEPLCGVGVDKDTMQTSRPAAVVVDRTLPPDDGRPPPAPSGLYPADGARVSIDVVKLMTGTLPRATRYELALEQWRGSSYAPYFVWTSPDGFRKTYPPRDSIYRFRARATNARGVGAWSGWVTFEYGNYRGVRPPSMTPPTPPTTPSPPPTTPSPPPASPPASPPMTPPGAPISLAPDGGVQTGAAVALTFDPITGATRYEVAIEYVVASGAFAPYVTYSVTTASKTFYPQVRGTPYRWRVHAMVAGTYGPWSPWAAFEVR